MAEAESMSDREINQKTNPKGSMTASARDGRAPERTTMAKSALFAILATSLVAGGLGGCRSARAPASPSAVAAAPRTVYYPSSPPPAPTYGPVTVARTPAPPPQPAFPPSGTPDGASADDGASGFPAAAPSDMAQAPAVNPVPTMMDNASAGADLDVAINQLADDVQRLDRQMKQAATQPGPSAPIGARPIAAGSEARAAAFAAQLRRSTHGEVEQNGNVVIVRMSDAFRPGSDKLKPDATITTTLLATASALESAGAREVRVVGHTDSTPIKRSKWPSNRALSQARAQTVAAELSRHGVPAGHLEVLGRGSEEPIVAKEKSEADRARNRRVEVHVEF